MDRRSVSDVALALALFALVAGLLQLLTPVPWDADTAYHVAVSRLVARDGVLEAFPWTPFSWLADNYADKELLFHLLLVPISGLSWISAAKIAGTVLGAALLLVLFLVLRAESVPRAAVWTLVPLAASGAFVVRFALVRPHLLSIPLALAVTWAAVRRRHLVLAAAAFLYPWSYVAWHTPVALALIVETARALSGRRPEWKPLAVAVLAMVAGVAVHPNAVNLVRLSWLVHVDILLRGAWGGRRGLELGGEFGSLPLGDAVRFLLVPFAMVAISVALAWRRRVEDEAPLAFACAAIAYAALTLASQRFVEYLAPFSAAALALALRARAERWAVPALAGAFVWTAALGARPVLALGTRGDEIPPAFTAFLRARIPPGAQVYTCEWGFTGELLLALPGRRFIVALDPVLFEAKDPDLYRLWYALAREGPPDARALIRSRFGARYALCFAKPESAPLIRRLHGDAEVRPLLESKLWYLYDLDPAAGVEPWAAPELLEDSVP